MKISMFYLTNSHEANQAESVGGSSVYDTELKIYK